MFEDELGNALTVASRETAESFDQATTAFIHLEGDVAVLLDGIAEADPGFALVHAVRALTCSSAMDFDGARSALQEVDAVLGGGSPREQGLIGVIRLYVAADYVAAFKQGVAHLADFPSDLLAAVVSMYALGGTAWDHIGEHAQEILDHLARGLPEQEPWVLAMRGFWAAEAGAVDDSYAFGEAALGLRRSSSEAVHSLAHAYWEDTNDSDGRALLDGWLAEFGEVSTYAEHLRWHAALHDVEVRDFAAAQARAGQIDPFQAAALLWLLSLRGNPAPPEAWAPMVALVQTLSTELPKRAPERPPPRGWILGYLALASRGDPLGSRLIDDLLEVLRPWPSVEPVVDTLLIPMVEGVGAFAAGDYHSAAERLIVAWPLLERTGGSRAQNDVFEETLVEALIRAGRLDDAREVLEARIARRTTTADRTRLERLTSLTPSDHN